MTTTECTCDKGGMGDTKEKHACGLKGEIWRAAQLQIAQRNRAKYMNSWVTAARISRWMAMKESKHVMRAEQLGTRTKGNSSR